MPLTARVAMAALLAGSLLLIIMATTMPWSAYYVGHSHWASVEWVPFSRRVRPLDVVLNVLLFTPFGYSALRTVGGPVRRPRTVIVVVAVGCLVSMSVELFQVYCHGRLPTTVDIFSNTLGTWLGVRNAQSRQR